ncbi:SAM-dependent methyltransferase [Symbioplanes lichenis]|uniref:SAM-dependent methyltransferase n=1 Tax=Symbioplanes lichenis TaxID=1629072 RepID=UPI0027399D64|nr:SAM-dependent methyltransferase [Actinoplanes lichenis]
MDRPEWVPAEVDMMVPNAARVYDAALGGTHNLPVDQEMLREAEKLFPDVSRLAHANRAYLGRAVRFLAGQGVRQFLDIGSGIPSVGNVHQIVPDRQVAYVDLDPVAVRHGRQLLADNPRAVFVRGDLRDPDGILDDPDVRRVIDFDLPVGLLLVAVLHFVPDDDQPGALVARLRDRLAPGSHVAISHGTLVEDAAESVEGVGELYRRTPLPFFVRSPQQIADLLDGWDPLLPGVVPISDWHPELDDEVTPCPMILGAVARR